MNLTAAVGLSSYLLILGVGSAVHRPEVPCTPAPLPRIVTASRSGDYFDRVDALVPMLVAGIRDSASWHDDPWLKRRLIALAEGDSLAIEEALARIVAGTGYDEMLPAKHVSGAIAIYRKVSGRFAPLYRVVAASNWHRLPQALEAVTMPLSGEEERVVFSLACDAGWMLETFYTSQYSRQRLESPVFLGSISDATHVLRAARPLLRGARRDSVEMVMLEVNDALVKRSGGKR